MLNLHYLLIMLPICNILQRTTDSFEEFSVGRFFCPQPCNQRGRTAAAVLIVTLGLRHVIGRKMNNSAPLLLGLAIPNLPFLAVAVAGLALSFSRRKQYPRAARWAAVGFACLLLEITLSVVQQYTFAIDSGSAEDRTDLFWIVSALYILRLATFIAIAVAIFAERPNAQQSAARA